jgi:hypothetical protein
MRSKLYSVFCIIFISCSIGQKTDEELLEGAWRMVSYSYYNTGDGGTPRVHLLKDSIDQVKIFHDGHFMWIRRNHHGGPEAFGFGKYDVRDGQLFESMEMNAVSIDKSQLETGSNYHFPFEVAGSGYKQFAIDMNGNKIYSEDYERIDR